MRFLVQSYIHLPLLIPIMLGIMSGSITLFWVSFLVVSSLTIGNYIEMAQALRKYLHCHF